VDSKVAENLADRRGSNAAAGGAMWGAPMWGETMPGAADKKLSDRAIEKSGVKVGPGVEGGDNLGDSGSLIAQVRKTQTAPPPRADASPYAKWLNEDVAYIITNAEREVFERLRGDEQRQQFIERFWLRRDPTPGTSKNELKEEHYRRIAFANSRFAWQNPGWKSDRGRIYITFGPPDEIESHPSGGRLTDGSISTTSPFELWRYRHIEAVGAEGIFAFVDSDRNGEYPLMQSPIAQTPSRSAPVVGALKKPSVDQVQETVPGARVVYVVGAVRRAGAFGPIERGTLSVRKVVALSGGLKPEAAPGSAKILRAIDNAWRRLELPANVRSILSGEAGDVPLLPDDILFIPTDHEQNPGARPAEWILDSYLVAQLDWRTQYGSGSSDTPGAVNQRQNEDSVSGDLVDEPVGSYQEFPNGLIAKLGNDLAAFCKVTQRSGRLFHILNERGCVERGIAGDVPGGSFQIVPSRAGPDYFSSHRDIRFSTSA
jgi:GWxTD domain-containing protein